MRLFKIAVVFLFLLFLSLPCLRRQESIKAQSCEGLAVRERIDCYQKELDRLGNQAKTLSNQIAQFDAQIRLTTLKISQTEEKIALLGGRIDQLETSLTALTAAFSSRAVETYKMARLGGGFWLLVTSPDLTGAVTNFHYLQRIQEADRSLLEKLATAQTVYKGEKKDQEDLQAELEKQKADLNNQKAAKAALLVVTRNDERRYQQLLAQALAEQGAIKRAISEALEVLGNGGGDPISAGDTIALIGNSGAPDCSFGSHLHFSILKDGNIQNPADYLSPKSFYDPPPGQPCPNGTNCWNNDPDGPFGFSGSWSWPLNDPIQITQGYGMTYWARLGWYGGAIHDGIDMTSDSNVIKAPRSGKIVRGTTTCDSPKIPGISTLKYAAIAHDGGIITVYLHIQ